METACLETTCPFCSHPFVVADAEFVAEATARDYSFVPTVEVECPVCAWEFAVDADGWVVDDGGLDPDGLFEVDAEGELDAEGLLTVTCPRCGYVHQADEPGLTACPRCRQLLVVDDQGRISDRKAGCFDCPHCGAAVPHGRDDEEVRCLGCGSLFDWPREDS